MVLITKAKFVAHKDSAQNIPTPQFGEKLSNMVRYGVNSSDIGCTLPVSLRGLSNPREGEMHVYITKNIIARLRCNDGVDKGNCQLQPGKYLASKTKDGALEILPESGEPAYILPFIWWEKLESGDILIAG